MTTLTAPLSVPPWTAGRTTEDIVTAECAACGVYLEQLPGGDVAERLRAFRQLHPPTAGVRHGRRVPDGWRIPLSGPGALSQ